MSENGTFKTVQKKKRFRDCPSHRAQVAKKQIEKSGIPPSSMMLQYTLQLDTIRSICVRTNVSENGKFQTPHKQDFETVPAAGLADVT